MQPKLGMWILLICALIILSASASMAKVVYVKTTGLDTNDGLSWTKAKKTVAAGITTSVSGDDIWVAAGTYVERITLKAGVGLYGGFAGTETLGTQRNWKTNVTMLDGNQGGIVVTSPASAAATTVIDGFTIQNGRTSDYGGGISCNASSPTISNNTITGNSGSVGYGGGIFCMSSSPIITNNTISANSAYHGGGIYCMAHSSPVIRHNLISGNTAAGGGGGIYCYDSSPTIVDNMILGNAAPYTTGDGDGGGAIFCAVLSSPTIANNTISGNSSRWGGGISFYSSSPTVSSNLLAGNSADFGGGMYCGVDSSPTVTNNTITGNSASSNGGAVYCYYSSPSISNNIVAFNSSGLWRSNGTPVLKNNCVYGNTGYSYTGLSAGTGDISADPVFVDQAGGDYHLQVSSSCIDAGDESAVQPGWLDMDGEPRICGSYVDIGADETDGVGRAASPVFSPGGGSYSAQQNVVITSVTPEAVIHYTTNGLDPTESDPIVSRAIVVDTNLTIKARASRSGWTPSTVKSANYTVVLLSYTKKQASGSTASIPGAVVTAVPGTSQFYVEADDRSCGIMVIKSGHGLTVGKRGDVQGTLSIASTGEKYVNATSITDKGTGSIEPLILSNRDVGGGDWNYNLSTGGGQRGMKEYRMVGLDRILVLFDAQGLNNIGMLITTTGRVTYSTTGYFYIDDGCAVRDNSGRVGVKILGSVPKPDPLPPGWTPVGHYVKVTGISTCFKATAPSTDLYRIIRAVTVELVE